MLQKIMFKSIFVLFLMSFFALQFFQYSVFGADKEVMTNEKAIKLLEEAYAKKEIPKPSCDTNVIDENITLALKLGINSTPKLVFSDGRTASGVIKAEELIRLIDSR